MTEKAATPSAISPPTQADFLTLLDDFSSIISEYETTPDSSAVAKEEHECRKKLLALFAAAQEANYSSTTSAEPRCDMLEASNGR